MKLEVIRGKEAAICAVIGAVGAVFFLFAFPKGAISTLMHEVLHLPGPGAGIAMVVGPFGVLIALGSRLLSEKCGGAMIAALAFGLGYALALRFGGIPTNPKGAFGSPGFIVAIAHLGLAAEVGMALSRTLKPIWRCLLSGALANAGLFVFYGAVIFPRTAGWIAWKDVPALVGLCLAGGAIAGGLVGAVSRHLSRPLAFKGRE